VRAALTVAATLLWIGTGCTPDRADAVNASGERAADTTAEGPGLRTLRAVPEATAAPGSSAVQIPATAPPQSLDQSRATAIVRATARVAPAVVSVNVIRTQAVRPRTLWESLYLPPGAQQRSAGFGSGVIVSEDGIVITNDHVISGASQIQVTLPGGRDADAELVGTDPIADIAVLHIEVDDIPVAPVGTAHGLMIGEWAIAIGNPLGNYVGDSEPTVTAGVVSAVNRNIAPSSEQEGFYFGMIQTDAAINPGNSGGALVNAEGEVIGINASIISRSGGSEGLGFAIPIDRALQIADDFLRFGEVRRAFVGLEVEPVEADDWGRTRGVRVSRVAEGSPADRAALQPGDRLLRAGGRALTGPLDWEGVLLDLRAGDPLDIEVDGQPRAISLEAIPFPSVNAQRVTLFQDLQLISVTPQIQLERGLVSEDGALVDDISDELSSRTGLRRGDVILQMNRSRIRSADDAAAFFDALAGQQGRIVLYLERNGNYGTTNLYWRG
jgi:serine protease Do